MGGGVSDPHAEGRLDVLDGLRGIAVLLVLWYHVWQISWLRAPFAWLEFVPETGFVGVHLFFFLSGFVIVYPFVRAAQRGVPTPGWGNFAWRRFIKIVPSYLVSIVVAFSVGYSQQLPAVSGGNTVTSVIAHLLFVHTWFPQTYASINGVLWTLALEVQFYCCFPLIWLAFRRSPYVTAAVMAFIALAWRMYLADCCGMSPYFVPWEENLPGYLDIFAFGMISAYIFVRYESPARTHAFRIAGPVLSAAGAALSIALLMNLFDYRSDHLQWEIAWQIQRRALLGLGCAMVALGFLFSPAWWQAMLANPVLKFFAAISYNLYLYNQLVARELLNWHIPPRSPDPQFDAQWQKQYALVAVASAIAVAAFFTYALERPFLRIKPPLKTDSRGEIR
jgi:peptidoglycan/LPS O-acetylase OafA/YrhL